MKTLITVVALLLASCVTSTEGQSDPTSRKWNEPVEPFRIIGSIYYVGTAELTSFLIVTREGHFLLDGGLAETAPQISANIRKLGFRMQDVKFLLNSQAHFDHAAGLAELQRQTSAQMVASEGDAPLLASGGRSDFFFKSANFHYEPVKVARTIRDNESLELGGVRMTARITPGHTKGCTTWTTTVEDSGHKYNVVFVCSASVPGYSLLNTPEYPDIVADYEKTFRILRELRCDVFLAAHASFFNMEEKRQRAAKYASPNPFIDPLGFRKYIEQAEQSFREQLERERRASKQH